MSCQSCMVGGGKKRQTGAGKIKDNTRLLKKYTVKDLKKLFRKYKHKYDNKNGRAENLAIFSMKVSDSTDKVKEWVKKNKPSSPVASVTPVLKKKPVRKLKKRINVYKKSKQCNTKLNSKKAVLQQMAKNQKIKVKKKPTVKDLKVSIKAFKKVNCPGLSKMRRAGLLAFIKAHKIPIKIHFVSKRNNKVREYSIHTPEREMKKAANDSYEKHSAIYNETDWADLAVDGYEVEEVATLKEAHEKALDLHNLLHKAKSPAVKRKSVRKKKRKISFKSPSPSVSPQKKSVKKSAKKSVRKSKRKSVRKSKRVGFATAIK